MSVQPWSWSPEESTSAWLHGFLSNRKQHVKLGNDVSNWLKLNGAVPQGSWLGPLYFITYIHGMPTLTSTLIHKYINDTTLTEAVTDGKDSNMACFSPRNSDMDHQQPYEDQC